MKLIERAFDKSLLHISSMTTALRATLTFSERFLGFIDSPANRMIGIQRGRRGRTSHCVNPALFAHCPEVNIFGIDHKRLTAKTAGAFRFFLVYYFHTK